MRELTPNRLPKVGVYPLKRLIVAELIQMVMGFGLVVVLRAQSSAPLAPIAAEIDQKVTNALNSLYANNQKAQSWEPRPRGSWSFPISGRRRFLSAHSTVSAPCEKMVAPQATTEPLPLLMAFRREPNSLATRSSS